MRFWWVGSFEGCQNGARQMKAKCPRLNENIKCLGSWNPLAVFSKKLPRNCRWLKVFDVTSGQLSVQWKFSGKMFYFSLCFLSTPWKLWNFGGKIFRISDLICCKFFCKVERGGVFNDKIISNFAWFCFIDFQFRIQFNLRVKVWRSRKSWTKIFHTYIFYFCYLTSN